MPNRKPNNGLVGVSLYLPTQILKDVNQKMEGKTQSEKLRNAIILGLSQATQACHTTKDEALKG